MSLSAPLAGLTGVAMVLLGMGTAHADRWYVAPQAKVNSFWEDNIRLNVNDPIESFGAILQGDLEVGRRTEISELSLNSRAVARRYFSESDLNTVDFYFDGKGVYQTERNLYELNAQVIIDSTLTSEEDTTGQVQERDRHRRWSLVPRWTHQLTPRVSFYVDAGYQQDDYDEDANLNDYTYITAGTGADYSLTERTDLLGRLSYSNYDADDSANESDTFGIMAGVRHAFSETLEATFLAGAQRAEITDELPAGGTQEDTTTGLTLDFRVKKQFEDGQLRVSLRRSLRPTGGDSLLETLGLRVVWDQPISARWRWSLAASAYHNDRPSGNAVDRDREFVSLKPSIAYKLDPEWSVGGGYQYRYQKFDNQPDSADSNAVFVELKYVPLIEQ